jgi:hypothetical protein
MMNDKQIKKFTGIVLDQGARHAMRRAIGDRSPSQYDKADNIADGIALGVRNAIKETGATIPGTPPVEGQVRAMFGKEGGEIILVIWPDDESRVILRLGDDGEFIPNDTESANTLADYLTALPVMA